MTDSLQLQFIETALAQVLYSHTLAKSSLWLLGNAALILQFATFVSFFVFLNYRQRKIAGLAQNKVLVILLKPFAFVSRKISQLGLVEKAKRYSFYIEFGGGALLFAAFTHISIFFAVFSALVYAAFRLFLFKKVRVWFRRKPGVVIPFGIYVLALLFLGFLLLVFNVTPALVEVSAEAEVLNRLQAGAQ